MNLIIKYLGVGRIEQDHRRENYAVSIVVGNFSDINNKIIPFFEEFLIFGVKYLDFLD
jgi:hypothetical protein